MDTPYSFDIAFLGLKDPSSAGRARMVLAMERLTGRSTAECQEVLSKVGFTIFDSLPDDQVKLIVSALDEAGAVCEIRPKEEAARSVSETMDGGMTQCPSCGFVQQAGLDECSRCGVIFSKMEKGDLRKMQDDQALEEAQKRLDEKVEAVRRRGDLDAQAKTGAPAVVLVADRAELIEVFVDGFESGDTSSWSNSQP